jgi:GNAT superfamily N-acetyltransferase
VSSVTLKIVTESNVAGILNVYCKCEDFLALGLVAEVSRKMVLNDLQESREIGAQFHGIFDPEDRMIGVVDYVTSGFHGKPHIAFINLLMIEAPFRSKGLGGQVVQLVEEVIRKDDRVTEIHSAVQTNNPKAIRFWKTNGYKVIGGPELQSDITTVFHLRKVI